MKEDKEKIEKSIKALEESSKNRDKVIKQIKESGKGFIHIEILLPDVSEEEFELWQHGGAIKKGYAVTNVATDTITATVAYNMLEKIKDSLEGSIPNLLLGDLISQLKRRLTIDEEDL